MADSMDEYLKQIDTGAKKPGTMREGRQQTPSKPLPRPKMPSWMGGMFEMGPKSDMPKPKSHAPKGMGNAVKGDLGMYRGVEAGRAMKPIKRAGRTGACAKPLTYRKPAIEGGMGPHAV